MQLLNKLERKLGHYAVPHVTIGLIACQVVVYLASLSPQSEIMAAAVLIPQRVLEGEIWRLVSFLFVVPVGNPIFAFFFWYLFYLMGSALEDHWGVFRYNVFLLIGYLATVAVSMLAVFFAPELPATGAFLKGSVFLAFAYLFPEFELRLFLILPVKIKWLALITWIGYGLVFLFGGPLGSVLVLAAISNFLLFFGADIVQRMRTGHWRMKHQAAQIRRTKKEPRHRCTVCGITNWSHPDMDFRYCTRCEGSYGYCTEHLRNHEHVRVESAQGPKK